ncbi:Predicted thiol-disulfide oxidoreductase YuxK, DCC family [Paenibacillus tianmuensis]|uniref:Predicted thiol-disulfide oxidoreductase YuxK, DCC family n=1 Tax=Paenibacillus tianmuensis TaxID=624147 RepID=A0A1G4TZQ9_9BACL|nr:DCC1-like thiol-disulfide oxidoreductase family protein [Paenibacillus tianmuensis]SCW86902.1 Predicted thiol-disulfide oxidoreductase YuxK, DCC family [Paenibacillus tianmuensis]
MQTVTDSCRIVFFDGECNFCNGWVKFIYRRDPQGVFKFASLQSPAAQRILLPFNHRLDRIDSIVLVEEGKYYTESTAVLRILKRLDGPIKYLYFLKIIPASFRNWAYRLFAKKRYALFGRRYECELPSKALRERFVDV